MNKVTQFPAPLQTSNEYLLECLRKLRFDTNLPVYIDAKLNGRKVDFTLRQGRETETVSTFRIETKGADETIERLASLKRMVSAMMNAGYQEVDTPNIGISSSTA